MKRYLVWFILLLCLCAAVLIAQLLRTRTEVAAKSHDEKTTMNSNAMIPPESSSVANTQADIPASSINSGSTHSVIQKEAPQDNTVKISAEPENLPLGQIDARFYPVPLVLSVQSPSDRITTTHISKFLEMVNMDFKRVSDLLSAGNFKVEAFNLSYWANIKDTDKPIVWRVIFGGPNRSVGAIRKYVYTDDGLQQEIKEQGYEVIFHGASIDKIIGMKQNLCVNTYTNGAFKDYSWLDDKYNWHVVNWDENGNITKEYIEGPGRTIAAKKNVIELFKNDPRKSNYVNEVKAQLEAIESAIETNK